MVISSSLDSSLTIVFTLLHNSSFGDKSLGKVDISMGRLLELQSLQPNQREYLLTIERDATIDNWVNLDVVLSLVDMKGNPSPARLSVRVTQHSTSAIAGSAVEKAQVAAQKLLAPIVVANVSHAITNAVNAISNQQSLITPFEALVNKLGVLVKIGDEIAKVCSSVFSPL